MISENIIIELITYIIVISIIGVLASAIVEVIKSLVVFNNSYQVNWTLFLVSEILVFLAYLMFSDYNGENKWQLYKLICIFISGFISAGIGIHGFDNYLKPVIEQIKNIIDYFKKK